MVTPKVTVTYCCNSYQLASQNALNHQSYKCYTLCDCYEKATDGTLGTFGTDVTHASGGHL